MTTFYSPRQVASSLGVSESSLKRWCDRGDIQSQKTPGGHRKLTRSAVIDFVRRRGRTMVDPTMLGLPQQVGRRHQSLRLAVESFYTGLIASDIATCRRVAIDMLLQGSSVAGICDNVFAECMHRVGGDWESGRIDTYQEHRATEMVFDVLHRLNELLQPPTRPTAIGCSVEGDVYALPSKMIEVSLCDIGWKSVSLGASLPFDSLLEAMSHWNPRMIWVSASTLSDADAFLKQYAEFRDRMPSGVVVAVGGRALDAELRKGMRFHAHGDNIQQLCDFAQAFAMDSPPEAD